MALDTQEVREILETFSSISVQDKQVHIPTGTNEFKETKDSDTMQRIRVLEYEIARKDSMMAVYEERIHELEKGATKPSYNSKC